ncbi:MAG TPA: VTT domain-containing protein [Pyrinomonadaceae bacterium]|nr:VTT domain-containing protein [Pyrinomonadaceae bacterium]
MSPRPSPSRAPLGADEGPATRAGGGLSLRGGLWRSLVVVLVVVLFVYAYRESGLWESPESLRAAGGLRAAVIIFLVMAGAWAFALPVSAFLLITPLLFPVHISVPLTTSACAVGAAAGYALARFVGGWWVERRRGARLRQFLSRHSSFLVVAALRLTPGVPHGLVNYAAGLASVPPARFLVATALAMGVKSYIYAQAVGGAVEANSLAGAVNPRTILSLLGLAALSVGGHLVIRLRERRAVSEAVPSGGADDEGGGV